MVFDSGKGRKDQGSTPIYAAPLTKLAMADPNISMSSHVERHSESPKRMISFNRAINVAADYTRPFSFRPVVSTG